MRQSGWLQTGLVLLALIGGQAVAEEIRHPMSLSLFYGDNLSLVNSLNPTDNQLAQLGQIVTICQRLVSEREKSYEAALTKARAALEAEREALRLGQPLTPTAHQTLETMREAEELAEEKLLVDLDEQIQRWRRLLTLRQASRIDWQPPFPADSADDERDEIEALEDLAGRLEAVGRELEQIRYLTPADYVTTRRGRLNTLLRPYLRPGSPRFDEAMDFTLRLTDEARLVPEREWAGRADEFPARLLHYLGALEVTRSHRLQPDYDWWDLHRVLTDPQTPMMFTRILASIKAPAPAPPPTR